MKKHGVMPSAIRGSWEALPFLITQDMISRSREMLEEARRLEDDPDVRRRVHFLEDGLRHLESTRRLLILADEKTRPEGTTMEEIRDSYQNLQRLRRKLTERHVIWGDVLNWVEKHWKIKTSLESAGVGAMDA